MICKDYLEIGIGGLNLIVVGLAAFWAKKIGNMQNEINKRSLKLDDYADVFLMPQTLSNKKEGVIGYKLLIKNASSYPIYLNKYIFDGVTTEIGSSIIPNNPDNWFEVPITPSVQNKGRFDIKIYFKDFTGRKYRTDGFGVFSGSWGITSKRRVKIKSKKK